MRKVFGMGIICIAFGMFLMMLIRDRMAGFLVIVIFSVAGYVCVKDD